MVIDNKEVHYKVSDLVYFLNPSASFFTSLMSGRSFRSVHDEQIKSKTKSIYVIDVLRIRSIRHSK
jgi:hypothetical protein